MSYSGGEGGIRTHGTRKGSTVFETARFNHSRTSPTPNLPGFPVTCKDCHYADFPSTRRLSLLCHYRRATSPLGPSIRGSYARTASSPKSPSDPAVPSHSPDAHLPASTAGSQPQSNHVAIHYLTAKLPHADQRPEAVTMPFIEPDQISENCSRSCSTIFGTRWRPDSLTPA